MVEGHMKNSVNDLVPILSKVKSYLISVVHPSGRARFQSADVDDMQLHWEYKLNREQLSTLYDLKLKGLVEFCIPQKLEWSFETEIGDEEPPLYGDGSIILETRVVEFAGEPLADFVDLRGQLDIDRLLYVKREVVAKIRETPDKELIRQGFSEADIRQLKAAGPGNFVDAIKSLALCLQEAPDRFDRVITMNRDVFSLIFYVQETCTGLSWSSGGLGN